MQIMKTFKPAHNDNEQYIDLNPYEPQQFIFNIIFCHVAFHNYKLL